MTERAFANYPGLAGTTVFVSGGASGIGEAIVRAFAGQGAQVGFNDIVKPKGEALAAELEAGGAKVKFVVADVTDIAAHQAAIGGVAAALGPINVLVNNAA